jgi:hypothetical protein
MKGVGAMRQALPPPLFGYNSSVLRGGRSFHVQTEDSGLGHPHVVTHIFAEGGRIIATHRTSYADHVDDPACVVLVRRLLVTQHREAFIALHEGRYDDPHAAAEIELARIESPPLATQSAANGAVIAAPIEHVGTPPVLLGLDPFGDALAEIIVRDVGLQLPGDRD